MSGCTMIRGPYIPPICSRRQYVAGVCGRAVCKFGHDLHTTHNNGVLSRHRLTRMADSEILEILREKEAGGAQKVGYQCPKTMTGETGGGGTGRDLPLRAPLI